MVFFVERDIGYVMSERPSLLSVRRHPAVWLPNNERLDKWGTLWGQESSLLTETQHVKEVREQQKFVGRLTSW
jgi:hypothetical protein